jgi:hypothetical protein
MMIQQGRHASTEPSTGLHITSSLSMVPALVPYPASVVRPSAGSPAQHNPLCSIGGRVEPPAPAQVVLPACGGSPAASPEGDPPRFLSPRNPRPLEAAFLVEGHNISQSIHSVAGEGK